VGRLTPNAFINGGQSAPRSIRRERLTVDEPMLLRGDYFRATMSAYLDFESELSKKASAATAADSPNLSLASGLSKIENYDIHVTQSAGHIVVQCNPTVPRKFMPVFGGGPGTKLIRHHSLYFQSPFPNRLKLIQDCDPERRY
jgi:hypothetical protein